MKKITLFVASLFMTMPYLSVAESIFEDDTIPPPLLPPEVDLYAQGFYGLNSMSDYDGDDGEMIEFNFGIEAHSDTESDWHIAGEFGASSFGEDNIETAPEFTFDPARNLESGTGVQNITEIQDFHVGLRLRKPVNGSLSYYGRVGMSFWQVENTVISQEYTREDENAQVRVETIGNSETTEEDGLSAYFGLGCMYRLSNSFSTGLEFQYNKNDLTPIYTGSVGLTYTF